jgi:hypothetical protein
MLARIKPVLLMAKTRVQALCLLSPCNIVDKSASLLTTDGTRQHLREVEEERQRKRDGIEIRR